MQLYLKKRDHYQLIEKVIETQLKMLTAIVCVIHIKTITSIIISQV